MARYDFYTDTDKLKKLIAENPDLPIVILVAEDIGISGMPYTYAPTARFSVEEIFDNDEYTKDGEIVITSKEALVDVLADKYYDEITKMADEEQEQFISNKMKELEPYWKKVIAIYADI